MPYLSSRIRNLGIETAFSVAGEAQAEIENGRSIKRYDLGDMDAPTPTYITDALIRAALDNRSGYVSSLGVPELREAYAADVNRRRGTEYSADNVCILPGGKPAIAAFVLSAIDGDGSVIATPRPGYPTYGNVIGFFGGAAATYPVVDTGSGFGFDIDAIEHLFKHPDPDRGPPRGLILNNCHNPTAAEATADDLQRLARILCDNHAWVLSDEAYEGIRFGDRPYHSIAQMDGMRDRTGILVAHSKTFAMTGYRLGALIGSESLVEAAGKVANNLWSCTSHPIQVCGVAALESDQRDDSVILGELDRRRLAMKQELIEKGITGMETHEPFSTFYYWVYVEGAARGMGCESVEKFRKRALKEAGVSFCTSDHFHDPGKWMARFSYSGISEYGARQGLQQLREWVEDGTRF